QCVKSAAAVIQIQVYVFDDATVRIDAESKDPAVVDVDSGTLETHSAVKGRAANVPDSTTIVDLESCRRSEYKVGSLKRASHQVCDCQHLPVVDIDRR